MHTFCVNSNFRLRRKLLLKLFATLLLCIDRDREFDYAGTLRMPGLPGGLSVVISLQFYSACLSLSVYSSTPPVCRYQFTVQLRLSVVISLQFYSACLSLSVYSSTPPVCRYQFTVQLRLSVVISLQFYSACLSLSVYSSTIRLSVFDHFESKRVQLVYSEFNCCIVYFNFAASYRSVISLVINIISNLHAQRQ